MISKKLLLFFIGVGIFVACFILIDTVAFHSLPKTSNQLLVEEKSFPIVVTGGDSVRIKDDLIFFWPLTFTENYYEEDGRYHWLFGYFSATKHPLVLLYWMFISIIVSLVVLLVPRTFFKK